MKKNALILLFVLGTLLISCAKVENISPAEEISYVVGSYSPSTKATLNSEGITDFRSKAWLHTNAGSSSLYGNAGETISYSNSLWSPSQAYYWPKAPTSYINFVSWYDNGGTPSVTETSITWTDRTIGGSDNIMFADAAWRYNSGLVPTLFHHALAQVKFQAKASTLSNDSLTYAITFNSVTLNNLHKTGSLSLINADPLSTQTVEWTNPQGGTPAWAPDELEVPSTISHVESVSITTVDGSGNDPNIVMGFTSVLPQAIDDITVTLCYSIRTNMASGYYLIENMTSEVRLADFSGSPDEWTMNHRTTYTITINPITNTIQFVPSTVDWRTDTSNTLYVE